VPKCTFVDCGVKCTNAALPLTKHCTKHVLNVSFSSFFLFCCHFSYPARKWRCLECAFFWFLWQDSSQMLFRSCGAIVHDNECREPVINFSEDTRCVYHTMMPSMPPPPLKDQVATYSSTQFAYFCFWFNFDLYFYKRFKWSTLLLFMWMMK